MTSISELWLRPSLYNLFSSEWGGLLFKVLYAFLIFVLYRAFLKPWLLRIHHHLECEVPGCSKWGTPVHGTSHRACHEHHPHLDPAGHSAEEIAEAAAHGHRTTTVVASE